MLVVLISGAPGRADEYGEWYVRQHLPDVMRVPGFKMGRRYTEAAAQVFPGASYKYLALYEIEAEDPQGVLDELVARSGSEEMPASDDMGEEYFCRLYRADTDWMRGESTPRKAALGLSA